MENGMQRALAVVEKGKLALVEIPIPEPDDYEVLVKNEACCYCNTTDQMITENGYATPSYPTILGHECFGPVVKVGKKVKKYKLGDRVICSNAIVTGKSGEYCSSFGGFCEYGIAGDLEAYLADHGTLDAQNQYRARYAANSIIDSDLPYRAASLAFPLAEVASAIRQVGDVTGKTVVIIGTGVMGSFHVLFAKLYGAKNIIAIDRMEKRLTLAKKFGATQTFLDTEEMTAAVNALGKADIVFECSGSYRALEGGLPYLKEGGMLAVYAVPKQPYTFDLLKCPINFNYKKIDPLVEDAIDEICVSLKKGEIPVDDILTHEWDFEEAPAAYEVLKTGDVFKGLVRISL